MNRYFSDNIQIHGNRTTVPRQRELHPFRSYLAWTLWKLGEIDQTLEHAEYANRLAPTNPSVKDTLAVILLDKKDTDWAFSLLRQAT